MQVDSVLSFIKLFGIALSGILSVVGAVANLRSRRGVLTRWGRFNIAGIFFGLFASLAAQLIENEQKQEEALKSLDQIQRILHPMGQVRVGFKLEIYDNTPVAKQLESSIREVVRKLQNDACASHQFCFPQPGMIVTNRMDEINQRAMVSVGKGSPIIPTGDSFDVKDLTERALDFGFFRYGGFVPTSDSSDINWLTSKTPPFDLELSMFTNIRDDGFMELKFDLETNKLLQTSRLVTTIIWSQTGAISSVLDLAGSNLVITGANVRVGNLQIKCIELEIQKGRSVYIPSEKMRILKAAGYADPIYFFTFPKSLDELNASCL